MLSVEMVGDTPSLSIKLDPLLDEASRRKLLIQAVIKIPGGMTL